MAGDMAAVYENLVAESITELSEIMNVSIKDRAKDMAKSALGRSVRTKDPMFWHAGLLMLGLSCARKKICAQGNMSLVGRIDSVLLSHIKLWRDKYGTKVEYIDDALAGAALLLVYEQIIGKEREVFTGQESDGIRKTVGSWSSEDELKSCCKMTVDRIYEYLMKSPRDDMGTLVYNADKSSNIFADGAGQVSMFLSLYGKVFDDNRATELARKQLENFRKYGMDERSGLPYHGYMIKDGRADKKGVLSWARAAGWLIMGLSEYVKDLKAEDDEMSRWYAELSKVLLSYQKEEGGYGWQIQAVEGHLDTSASGMIAFGIINGNEGSGSDNQGNRLKLSMTIDNLWVNISEGKVLNALSSCDDFAVHYQTYGHYTWGQGAVLAALSLI